MTLALFDLDNTLLNGDSDHSWGEYLCALGVVDSESYQQQNNDFFVQYQQNRLDPIRYLNFQLGILANFDAKQLHQWRADYLHTVIEPMIRTGRAYLLEKHRTLQHKIVIITGTNNFITQAIADALNVDTLLAPEVEIQNGQYTGNFIGTHCYAQGKVNKLQQWLEHNDYTLQNSWFYSDSTTDLPLLELVDYPIAVNPDKNLRQTALQRNWPIID